MVNDTIKNELLANCNMEMQCRLLIIEVDSDSGSELLEDWDTGGINECGEQ